MLKQLIQRLLDSRTTPEEAAHSAMPRLTGLQSSTATIPTVSSTDLLTITTGVAPCDGWVRAQLEDNQAKDITLFIQNNMGADSVFCYSKDWGWPSGSMPIAKGDSYTVNVRYGTPPMVASILHIDFYPNFGAS